MVDINDLKREDIKRKAVVGFEKEVTQIQTLEDA
jgi:hypothetical protein